MVPLAAVGQIVIHPPTMKNEKFNYDGKQGFFCTLGAMDKNTYIANQLLINELSTH